MLLAHPNPSQFMHVDAKHRTVRVALVAGYNGSNGGFNFDGYGRGELTVSIPRGWRVDVTCSNRSGMYNSCVVVRGAMSFTPAFPGASTPNPTQGMQRGRKASFSFVASRVGSFRFASVVPGHEEARMWDVLEITRGGKPAITARPGP
jgi:Sulfocyanin (SoxE) domain